MAAGSGMEDIQALIPIVGSGEAASAEEITQQSISLEEPAYRRYETRENTHREREAQRGISLLATVTTMNNNLYKRLQSHFI